MADTVIYTANFGGYDRLLPQVAQDVPVDWICLTDDPAFRPPAPWQAVFVNREVDHPNLAAKFYKTMPPWDLAPWERAIWIDANMEITEPAFVREASGYVHDDIAIWRHPRRTSVYDEITASLPDGLEGQDGKYAGVPLLAMAAAYRAEGFPADRGLYASGTIVWERGVVGAALGAAWWAECERWGCFHDQLVLPVVAWRLGLVPGTFGVHQIERRYSSRRPRRIRGVQVDPNAPFYLANRWLRIWPHIVAPER